MKHNKQSLLSLFFEKSSDAIIITDVNNQIIMVNSAFEQITGYSKNEVIGQKPSFLKSGKHSDDFYKTMWKTLLETGFWNGEVWDKRKNGQIYLKSISINVIKDANNNITNYSAIFTDISTTKKQNQQLDWIKKEGCYLIQGYFLGKPEPYIKN